MNALKSMFIDNKWLWFHILAGGILARIALIFVEPAFALGIVFVVAVSWELFEMIKDDVEKIYGSKKEFLMDAAGDVIGAAAMAFIIVF